MTTLIEQYVIVALRDHGELYGVPLRQCLSRSLGQDVSFGEVYAACDRLEAEGLIVSREGEGTPERGGRRKRLWKLAPKP